MSPEEVALVKERFTKFARWLIDWLKEAGFKTRLWDESELVRMIENYSVHTLTSSCVEIFTSEPVMMPSPTCVFAIHFEACTYPAVNRFMVVLSKTRFSWTHADAITRLFVLHPCNWDSRKNVRARQYEWEKTLTEAVEQFTSSIVMRKLSAL